MKRMITCFALLMAFTSVVLQADDYVVVGHDGKVFDSANAKGYATTNQNGDEVVVSDGMVFKKKDSRTQGWDLIEYSPGLNGFILQSLEEKPAALKVPSAGSYKVVNNPSATVNVTRDGDSWVLSTGSSKYFGQLHDGAVVFFNSHGDVAFSLVSKGGKTYVFSYDNAITKFF